MVAKPKKPSWEDRVRLFLKAEIKRANVTYEELAERLKEHGIAENAAGVANKLARGTFAATYFFAIVAALGLENIRLEDV
jgi:hypothetical protein